MPVLENEQHEIYAQGVAKGMPLNAAYEAAGFKRHDSSASRLLRNAKVEARVAELQKEAAALAVITIASATESLLRLADKAEEDDTPSGYNAARQAIMDACKLNGLLVDRSESNVKLGVVAAYDPDGVAELIREKHGYTKK